jgi:hypothetical protein
MKSTKLMKLGRDKNILSKSLLLSCSVVVAVAINYMGTVTIARAESNEKDSFTVAQFAPRGRQFECDGINGTITPNISGAFFDSQSSSCYIPAKGRQCVAVFDPWYGGKWGNCKRVEILTDPNTGKKYYKLNSAFTKFIFSN